MNAPLKAPFPWFGGKRTVADKVWSALGDVNHYVEPFFGSGAVMLARPHEARVVTINDADGMVSNFWRAIKAAPDETAHHADWPVNECDLHARHLWLVGERPRLTERLMADAEFYDAKAAGWWCWGACAWIGSGWCSGEGPWRNVNGVLSKDGHAGQGINRQLPHLSAGRGINRQLPHLGDAGKGINRQRPHLSASQGINRKLPHLSAGRGDFIRSWFRDLSAHFAGARVACGDWKRVCGPSVLRAGGGVCGVFLDPPYAQDVRSKVYAHESDAAVECLEWAKEAGKAKAVRIVLAGYDGEHNDLEALGWRCAAWKAAGGYGSQGDGRGAENAHKERLWLSPHCLHTDAPPAAHSVASIEDMLS